MYSYPTQWVRDQDDLPLLDAVQSHSRQEKRTRNEPTEESLFCWICRVTNLNPNFHIFGKQILWQRHIVTEYPTEYSSAKDHPLYSKSSRDGVTCKRESQAEGPAHIITPGLKTSDSTTTKLPILLDLFV